MIDTLPKNFIRLRTEGHQNPDSGTLRFGLLASVAREMKAAPAFIELPLHIQSLPDSTEIAKLLRNTRSEIVWRIEIDEFHSANLETASWYAFSQSIESAQQKAKVILTFDRHIEYSNAIIDNIEVIRDASMLNVWIETEHLSWKRQGTQRILKSLKLPHVFLDAPHLPGLVKDVSYDAGSTGYLRCCGRNAAKWFERGGNERYCYDYSAAEIKELVYRIQNLMERYEQVYVSVALAPSTAAVNTLFRLQKEILL